MRARLIALRGGLAIYGRALSLVAGARPWRTVAFMGSVVGLALLPVAQPVLLQQVVDRITAGAITGSALTGVLLLAAGYALTLSVPVVASPVQDTVCANLEDQAVAAIDRRLIDAGRAMVDLTSVERPATQDQVRLHQEMHWILPRFFSYTRMLLGQGVTFIGLLVVLAGLHPLIPLVLGLAVIPRLAVDRRMNELQYAALRDRAPAAREMDYCARLATEPEGAKEVRVFGIGSFLLDRFYDRFSEAYGAVAKIRIRHMWLGAAVTALHVLGLVGGFAYVAHQASQRAITAGDVALYLNAVIQFEAAMFFLPMGFGALFQLRLHAGHLFSFTDNAGAGIQVTPPPRAAKAPVSFERGIELRGVGFAYPEGDSPVLERIDLTLPAGQVTALVGQNGAGKSTLVKLLTRMYDPDTGQVLLDGRPLSAYDLDSLRSRIGVVYQDYARFALTFADNIATGDVTATDPELQRAAALAGADDIAAELPNGWDTMLTRRFDGGVDLSGGQWQKIATARGFLRDAAFVILDEPTAALDADAERALFDRFRQIMAGRTALLISHRFSTVRMADHIAVLEEGHITETGTHNELVNAGARYAQLFEMQAGRYR